MIERIQPRRRTHLATAAVLLGLCGVTVHATRPAAAPEGLPDPATMRLDYRPGAYFPPEFPLHGEVRLLTSPVVEAGKRTRVKVEYTVGDMAIEEGMAIEIFKHFTSDVEQPRRRGPGLRLTRGAIRSDSTAIRHDSACTLFAQDHNESGIGLSISFR